jgi:two-component system, cell cycle sensor histidine kinase and response regulator CckA
MAKSNSHISVYSQPGQGTVFKIYLPQIKNPHESTQPDPPLSFSPGGKETILLVEDNEMVRQLVHQVLDKNGQLQP